MIYYDIQQNSDEWLVLRSGKITASEFADAMSGESTLGYKRLIYKKRAEIRLGEPEESFSNEWMERGHELEPDALKLYEAKNLVITKNGGFFEHSKYIGASPDRLVGEDGLLEIKCPKASTMERYIDENRLPNEYKWQVQGQLFVTDRKWCDFMAYHPMYEPIIIRVVRDEEMIKALSERLNLTVKRILRLEK